MGMTFLSNDIYSLNTTVLNAPGDVEYYIKAVDLAGNQMDSPLSAIMVEGAFAEETCLEVYNTLIDFSKGETEAKLIVNVADKPEKVTLMIYTMTGKLVSELEKETEYPPGVHEVSWDATDYDSADVASGVYLVKAKIGGYEAVKKIMVVR